MSQYLIFGANNIVLLGFNIMVKDCTLGSDVGFGKLATLVAKLFALVKVELSSDNEFHLTSVVLRNSFVNDLNIGGYSGK